MSVVMDCSSFLSFRILIYTVIMGGDNEQMNNLYLPGNALVADPTKHFGDLSRFGNTF